MLNFMYQSEFELKIMSIHNFTNKKHLKLDKCYFYPERFNLNQITNETQIRDRKNDPVLIFSNSNTFNSNSISNLFQIHHKSVY
jgi:hypothetical protein